MSDTITLPAEVVQKVLAALEHCEALPHNAPPEKRSFAVGFAGGHAFYLRFAIQQAKRLQELAHG